MIRVFHFAAKGSVVALVLICGFVLAGEPKKSTPFFELGMRSSDGKLLYLASLKGGIEAIAIESGKVVWTNPDAKYVVGASNELVYGLVIGPKKTSFHIVAIDAAHGKTGLKSDVIEMPEWAVMEESGRSHRFGAFTDDGRAIVVWQARAHYDKGYPSGRAVEEAARKEASGVAGIDLKTGKVVVIDRIPKPEEFLGDPAGNRNGKIGDYEFAVEWHPPVRGGRYSVHITAKKDGKEVWTHVVAGDYKPPRRY